MKPVAQRRCSVQFGQSVSQSVSSVAPSPANVRPHTQSGKAGNQTGGGGNHSGEIVKTAMSQEP